ncbi:Metallo-dependent phosphatase [Thozetella sp. PMI_491]|nr:Metallo-dependent phosphatase [Thozetella sp. PMI_491]
MQVPTVKAVVLAACWALGSAISTPLRFTQNGTFQISVFEDLHFGEGEDTSWGPLQDLLSAAVMEVVLQSESPQLVVLNGDLITGENTQKTNASSYVDKIAAPLVSAGLPWASTYGNHDSDFNLSRADIYAREKTFSNSLTGNMVASANAGVTNYYLLVYPHDTSSTTPALVLWFFDSRGGNYYQQKDSSGLPVGQPNWVDESVVTWFTSARANLTSTFGKVIPSLGFVHIPVNAFLAYQKGGVSANSAPGINADVPLSQQGVASGQGGTKTVFTYDGQDIPFMQALLDTEGLIAVFSGHDHGDDWCFKWNSKLSGMNLTGNGLNLCFGRHSGYGGYGSWTRGSRQILITEASLGSATQTWIRREDSAISGSVVLNSTYGTDKYPVVSS